MKKIVIMILLILPFVLSIMISLTGKIISLTTYIAVESISFVDEYDKDIDYTVNIEVGEEHAYEPYVKILPNLATNKKYQLKLNGKYKDICIISENKIVGVGHGFAEVVVVSDYNSNIIDTLVVKVSDEEVRSITLNATTKELKVKETYTLIPTVVPNSAINKNITFTSSNPEYVTVSASGLVTVVKHSNTPVVITATSVSNPNVKAECTITTKDEESAFIFKPVKEGSNLYVMQESTLDLFDILLYNPVDKDKITFSVVSMQSVANASVEGSILTVGNRNVMFKVEARCGGQNPIYIYIKLG